MWIITSIPVVGLTGHVEKHLFNLNTILVNIVCNTSVDISIFLFEPRRHYYHCI